MLLSKYGVFDDKKSIAFKEQEARVLLSSLRIRTPLTQIAVLFCFKRIKQRYNNQTFISRR